MNKRQRKKHFKKHGYNIDWFRWQLMWINNTNRPNKSLKELIEGCKSWFKNIVTRAVERENY